MANKKISELAQYTITPSSANDLLLISDVVAHESKKLTLADLGTFLSDEGHGTSSYAITASYSLSASYAPGTSFVSASWVSESVHIINADTASYFNTSSVTSASFATTASYALNGGGGGGTQTTVPSASWASSSISSSYSSTASYALNGGSGGGGTQTTVPSASWVSASAYIINSDTASYVQAASYLNFDGTPNGTASYAIFARNTSNVRQDYGTFYAITQSVSVSQLDLVSITPTFGGQKATNFEIYGTIDAPFSSSNVTNGRIEMFALNRQTGVSQSLDFSPIYVAVGGAAAVSGTLRYPFVLRGEAQLYGLYEVYITASGGVYLDQTRAIQFNITSISDQLSVQPAEQMLFSSYPINANMLYSSSLHPGVAYQGSASQVIYSGSYDVTSLLIPPSSVNILSYTWTLTGLVTMSVDNNAGLTDLGGISVSCVSMSAANCGLSFLPDISSGSLGYLNVSGNSIVSNLVLPTSMSYLNVAGNYYINLPVQMPYGLTVLISDGNGMSSTPAILPDTLITTSFNNCPNLSTWLSPTFPSNLEYLDTNASPLSNLPASMPTNLLYVNVSNCQLPPYFVSSIASGLVSNNLTDGTFAFINNPASESAYNITYNVNMLISRGWNVIS